MKSSTGIAALVLLSAAAVYLIVRPGPRDLAEPPAAPLPSNDESPQRDEAREAPPLQVPASIEAPAGLAAILQRHGCLAIGATTVDSSAYQLVAYVDVEGYAASVIGPDGVVETFRLDWAPNRVRLVMHEQGVPIVGVGNLRLNSSVGRDYDTPEPVQIYRGSNLEYSSEKALNFGIAPDGESFWVVEPTSDISSRLLVRNFSSGATFQYDLGHAVAGGSIEGTHSVVTAVDGQSVMLLPDPESFEERVFFSTHNESDVSAYATRWRPADRSNLRVRQRSLLRVGRERPEVGDRQGGDHL